MSQKLTLRQAKNIAVNRAAASNAALRDALDFFYAVRVDHSPWSFAGERIRLLQIELHRRERAGIVR